PRDVAPRNGRTVQRGPGGASPRPGRAPAPGPRRPRPRPGVPLHAAGGDDRPGVPAAAERPTEPGARRQPERPTDIRPRGRRPGPGGTFEGHPMNMLASVNAVPPASRFAPEPPPSLKQWLNDLGMRTAGSLGYGLSRLLGSRAGQALGIITYHRVSPHV